MKQSKNKEKLAEALRQNLLRRKQNAKDQQAREAKGKKESN